MKFVRGRDGNWHNIRFVKSFCVVHTGRDRNSYVIRFEDSFEQTFRSGLEFKTEEEAQSVLE